jgi:hypothetical protein
MAVYTTLAEAKSHLRVDCTDDDVYIAYLQNLVEEVVLGDIKGGAIVGTGTVQTAVSAALIGVGTSFLSYIAGDQILVSGETIRTIAGITTNTNLTVTVNFTTTAVLQTYTMYRNYPLVGGLLPLKLKQAMLLALGHFYNNREASIIGVNMNSIVMGYDNLISEFKNRTVV